MLLKDLTQEEEAFRDFMDREFYQLNDKAHRIDHIDEVWGNICYLVNTNKMLVNRKVVFLAVYLHDMFCSFNRGRHNILANAFILSNLTEGVAEDFEIFSDLSKEEIETIATMVLYHRSSINIEDIEISDRYIMELVSLMRAADKGKPDFKSWLARSMDYHSDSVNQLEEVRNHFIEKFLPNGYAWKDIVYKKLYHEEYRVFQEELETWLDGTK